ncbi:hypothetical protein LguiA_030048 [Lonicera macranthoides]
MKLHRTSNLILLISTLFAGYFFPYVAPLTGQPVRRFTVPVKNEEILKTKKPRGKLRRICYGHGGVVGCDPKKGGIP